MEFKKTSPCILGRDGQKVSPVLDMMIMMDGQVWAFSVFWISPLQTLDPPQIHPSSCLPRSPPGLPSRHQLWERHHHQHQRAHLHKYVWRLSSIFHQPCHLPDFDLWSDKQDGHVLRPNFAKRSEKQNIPKKVTQKEKGEQLTSGSETNFQNETASTEAKYFKVFMAKTENVSDPLQIVANSEHNMTWENKSSEQPEFQDATHTFTQGIITSTPSSSPSSVSISSPLQPSSPQPPTTHTSPTPPPVCSSEPSQLQGSFTPLLQNVSLSEVEEEMGWVPSGGGHL